MLCPTSLPGLDTSKVIQYQKMIKIKAAEDVIKQNCDNLHTFRMNLNKLMQNPVENDEEIIQIIDQYVPMLVEMAPILPAYKAKSPEYKWYSACLVEKRLIESKSNTMGDFNLEIIMCLWLKAMLKNKQAEKIARELASQLHPEVENYKIAWKNLIDAAKITEFLSKFALKILPKYTAEEHKRLPELNQNILTAFCKLFIAQTEMLSVEKGKYDIQKPLNYRSRAKILKDVLIRLSEALSFFETGLKEVSKGAQKKFIQYYLTYCKGMKATYEAVVWYNYGMSFEGDQERKNRLGCFKECIRVLGIIKKDYISKLPKHKDFIEKMIHEMEGTCNSALEENSKIFFDTPKEIHELPNLAPTALFPSLEYMPEGYVNLMTAMNKA